MHTVSPPSPAEGSGHERGDKGDGHIGLAMSAKLRLSLLRTCTGPHLKAAEVAGLAQHTHKHHGAARRRRAEEGLTAQACLLPPGMFIYPSYTAAFLILVWETKNGDICAAAVLEQGVQTKRLIAVAWDSQPG